MITVFLNVREQSTTEYNDFVKPVSGCYIIANRDVYNLNILLTI